MPIEYQRATFPWNPLLATVGAIAACMVLLLAPAEPAAEVACTDSPQAMLLPVDAFPPGLGVPAVGPLEGQKRPPCKGPKEPGLREYNVGGACWYKVEGTPPCGEGYEHNGACFSPVPARLKVHNAMYRGLRP